MVQHWHKPDILLCNGDMIEGRQDKQGGAELITNDRNIQCDMACQCIKAWDAYQILMTYGTKYHVGDQAEDFEYTIAEKVDAIIEGRMFFRVEDMLIDARHKVGSSSVPQGRASSIMKDVSWNLLKSALSEEPKADITIRSHVHYHIWIEQPGRVMFTTPALQLSRGRYGSRECVGETHWGAVRLTISGNEIVGKDVKIWKLHANRPRVYRAA